MFLGIFCSCSSIFHALSGHYDVLILRMKLRRKDTALILRIYIPLTVMVIMSWLCFFIDYRSVPARTTMNAALVLTVITFITSIQQELPRAPTGRVVDIHMLVCFLYIFAGLIEYSLLRSIVIESMRSSKKQRLGAAKVLCDKGNEFCLFFNFTTWALHAVVLSMCHVKY